MTAPLAISHHPGEDLVAAYAAGALDEASALAVATHMTLCPACRRQAAGYEALGGTMIDALPEAVLRQGALAATLARAKASSPPAKPTPVTKPTPAAQPARARQSVAMLPAPLRRYVGGDVDAARWLALGRGIHHMPLVTDDGATARLLRIAPGRAVFAHGHGGTELTLVLRGSFTSMGARFVRGDIEVADESVNHHPVAGTEDVCVCLVVTDAPLRFDGWLGRLMQPFIGI
ncbi:ChrR family anti-sigma-E factor [Dongia sp.]|uniref:ChrR family anti-sigma-E factor n=1 Tax=Dongia sp. TaxID=1977262 RepID=UPI0035B17335